MTNWDEYNKTRNVWGEVVGGHETNTPSIMSNNKLEEWNPPKPSLEELKDKMVKDFSVGDYGDYHDIWGERDENGNVTTPSTMGNITLETLEQYRKAWGNSQIFREEFEEEMNERRVNKDQENKLQAGYASVIPNPPGYPYTPWTPNQPVGKPYTTVLKSERIYGTRRAATVDNLNQTIDQLLEEGWQSFDITKPDYSIGSYYIVPSITRAEAVRRAKEKFPHLDIS